jgi:hypothetical protein
MSVLIERDEVGNKEYMMETNTTNTESIVRRPRRKRIILSSILICTISTTAFGIFGIGDIVYDPKLDATLAALHSQAEGTKLAIATENIAKWVEQLRSMQTAITTAKDQLQAARDWQGYMQIIHGGWKERLNGMADQNTVSICTAPINLQAIGWGGIDDFKQLAETRDAATALEQLRQVLDARARSTELSRIRDNLEVVYGDVPVTKNGLQVEAAYREMGTASAFSGELNIAIAEKLENIRQLKEEINSGVLAPGDLERKMALVAAEQVDVDLLQAQAINQSNRLAINQLGFQASTAGTVENNRLKERAQRLEMVGGINFGMKLHPRVKGEE